MTALLYADVHVPFAVIAGLKRRGIDVLTCQQDGTRESTDSHVLTRATELGRVLLTQDEDFLAITTQWQRSGQQFRTVIFAPQIGTGIGQIIEDVQLLLSASSDDELWSNVFHLPLR